MSGPKVSGPEGSNTTVVVVTRNRADELAHTLTRLGALEPLPPLVVVDNASTDDTARMVAADFPGVTLLRLSRNEGAAARNHGVRHANTPYVAFSDDDSWWAPGALATAERVLAAHPDLGLVAATTPVGEHAAPDPVTPLLADSPLGTEPGLPGPSVLGFLACSAIVRREAFLGVGGFSPLLRFVAEEKLLALDLAAAGWALCYVDTVRAHHHPSPRHTADPDRLALEERNNLLITWLRRPLPRAVADTAALARRTMRDPIARRAAVGAAVRAPAALAQRRPLPAVVERRARILEQQNTQVAGERAPEPPGDPDAAVTVVVITRNRRDELLHTLRHMSTLPDAAPIIVVDNASTDGTPDAVAAEFPAIHLITANENLGALGRNVAVERVRTRYVSFCDDDTRWQPGALG